MFIRKRRLRFVKKIEIMLSDVIASWKDSGKYQDITRTIEENENLKVVLEKLPSIAQIALIDSVGDSNNGLIPLCVSNTHSFFHPHAPHIRVLQVLSILDEVVNITRNIKSEPAYNDRKTSESITGIDSIDPRDLPVLFCGDLNATVGSMANRFLLEGATDAGMEDWSYIKSFCWGNKRVEEIEFDEVETKDFGVGLNLENPLGKMTCLSGIHEFTNFISLFEGMLDYILTPDPCLLLDEENNGGTQNDRIHFARLSYARIPSREALAKRIALPSVVVPSDHLAVGCDLYWIRKQFE